ncbi:hypothetical protein RRG08_012459 [Elysia crispata]|uniref:Integrase catalytic domain-containing protein n=1 Tax=Elysia crispata TaxID=231223 RepID=A0AAE1A387_9GAST|nr:hypothetical protein RRG08_012459 [Elysia crispata]
MRRLQKIERCHRARSVPHFHIHDFSVRLKGKTIFSKIDLFRGCRQIPVAPEDIPKSSLQGTKATQASTRASVVTRDETGFPKRRTVFDVVHNISHPGVKATVKMVSDKFVWHGMQKQVKAILQRGITTPKCVHALITGWIARFGVRGDISSDRGAQFTSSLWSEIAARLGVKLHHTSAYHPQANGMIERFHRTLKTLLKARLTGPNMVE